MASYSVNITKHATAVADTVDTITIAGNKRGFRVQRRPDTSTAGIWWTWGYTAPTDPAIDGSVDGSYYTPANSVDPLTEPLDRDNETSIIVKVRSAEAVAYSVESW